MKFVPNEGVFTIVCSYEGDKGSILISSFSTSHGLSIIDNISVAGLDHGPVTIIIVNNRVGLILYQECMIKM